MSRWQESQETDDGVTPMRDLDSEGTESMAAFEDLPERAQQQLIKAVYGCSNGWTVFKAFIEAAPGRKIAMLRESKHLTQSDLAKLADVRQADVSVAENDFGRSRVEIVERIAAALGTNLHDLVCKADPPEPLGADHVDDRDAAAEPGQVRNAIGSARESSGGTTRRRRSRK